MRLQKPLIDAVLKEKQSMLVILDACNYNYFLRWFKDKNLKIAEQIEPVQSSATRTILWVVNTFENTEYDAVYVSANPFVNSMGTTMSGKIAVGTFTRIVDAWKDWDNEKGTCTAETVNEHAVLNLSSPRLVVHYMQPHQPYIGEIKVPDDMYYTASWYKMPKKYSPPPIRQIDGSTVKRFTEQQRDIVRKAYYSNMDYVCNEMLKLIKKRRGLISITADHSELMGENGRWFHWGNHSELRVVPWLSFIK